MLDIVVCQQLAAFQHHTVFYLFFANNLLFAFASFEIIAGIVVVRLAGFPCACLLYTSKEELELFDRVNEQIIVRTQNAIARREKQ